MLGFARQLLEHGKLITKANFPTFVETWNWLVDGFYNLKGDGDLNNDAGFIQVDRTNPTRPVVRLINREKLAASGEETEPLKLDEYSVDKNEDEEVELAHFADAEMDSGKGFIKRIKVNKETGELTTDEKDVMLVARKNGRVIYVPFGGDGEDPEAADEPPKEEGDNPCDHDEGGGKYGGVSSVSDVSVSPSGDIGGNSYGGVSAVEAEKHTGDDNCNCD